MTILKRPCIIIFLIT